MLFCTNIYYIYILYYAHVSSSVARLGIITTKAEVFGTMAKSMTAYGRATGQTNGKNITVEIKSVNSRFFDPNIKISRAFSFLEDRVKARVQKEITRAKVDVYIGVEITENVGCSVNLDSAYAQSYIEALKNLRDSFGLTDDITVMSVAQNREIFTYVKPEEDAEKDWADILPFLEEALESHSQMRAKEGENLINDISRKKASIMEYAQKIALRSKDCVDLYREKFESRLRALLDDKGLAFDDQRILTECAIYADKVAIDEELVRLSSHFRAFDEIVSSSEPVGRKLDFLLQEMNRETNTIGSKCSDSEIAHTVVAIKCELEKIREQIQNLE